MVLPCIRSSDAPDEILFQQDGAPPHFANVIRDKLNTELPVRWIGRRGSVEWPARSPDLTPLDFFFWGYLKNKVYATKIRDKDHLKEVIKHHVEEIRRDMNLIQKVTHSVGTRIQGCIDAEGGHFEDKR